MVRRVTRFLEERPVRDASDLLFCHLALWQSVYYTMHVDDEYQQHYISAVPWTTCLICRSMVPPSKFDRTGSVSGEYITL